jgi:sterol desaturase/sphingolipid hydroxylase (fatty acid hydroxylase superfamily)
MLNASTETIIRAAGFIGVFATMAAWEVAAPRRTLTVGKTCRWFSNLGLVTLNSILVRLVLPLSAFGTAAIAAEHHWGLLNHWSAPAWIKFAIAVAALDFAIYLQHVLFHAVPALWRLHMVHHADLDFDVTTGLRFHTLEILVSTFLKIVVVAALGPPVWAVLTFEVLLNATSMFNHANVRLPAWLDRVVRLIVVTPDMHRIHHSVERPETNSNFGFNLPWWDRLLGTYRSQPAAGHDNMQIGVSHVRDEKVVERLPRMLALPFVRGTGEYPIGGRGAVPVNQASGGRKPPGALPASGAP